MWQPVELWTLTHTSDADGFVYAGESLRTVNTSTSFMSPPLLLPTGSRWSQAGQQRFVSAVPFLLWSLLSSGAVAQVTNLLARVAYGASLEESWLLRPCCVDVATRVHRIDKKEATCSAYCIEILLGFLKHRVDLLINLGHYFCQTCFAAQHFRISLRVFFR